ncbi:putative transcriptional regulator, TetR [Streptomyces sulfonofaciens]|uniref:Transcriptional regulator, TetR n=1 Tax=Streptomyces sulfonofaciens TaxID=68272 RepID=A0A919L6M2_9ACTN|nr:TetR/AcrR family transcriptional regulator [Streptomyces sulfonofaciens]GHH84656.1 putative transcriptional regulator, TetR [Streptomyces sulfonofaciens]
MPEVKAGARRPGRPSADTPPLPSEREILARGLEAFADLGYDRASARELARRLGVSHNFIHDRYGSKAAFWRAVVDDALGAQLSLLPSDDPDADPADRLRAIVAGFYRTTVDAPGIGRLCADEFSRDSERLDYLYERYVAPTLARIKLIVDVLADAGRMARLSMDVLFFAVVSPASAMAQMPLAHRLGRSTQAPRDERVAMAETLADLAVNALLATGGEGRPRR